MQIVLWVVWYGIRIVLLPFWLSTMVFLNAISSHTYQQFQEACLRDWYDTWGGNLF